MPLDLTPFAPLATARLWPGLAAVELQSVMVSLVAGALLAALGLGLGLFHIRAWRAQRADPEINSFQRLHYRAQLWRRLQVSGLLVLIGVLIPLGDYLFLKFNRAPRAFAMYWMGVLVLTGWIVVLGVVDWLSGYMFRRAARGEIARLNRQRREMEDEAARLRDEHRNHDRAPE